MTEFSLGEAVLGTAADMSGMQRDLDRGEDMAHGWLGRIGNVLSTGAGVLLGNVATGALNAISGGITNLASSMISGNAQFEDYNTRFMVLLGSADAAQQRMAEITQFAASTPFDLPGVVEAKLALETFGLTSEDTMQRFGFSADNIQRIAADMAAGTGAEFADIANYLGKFAQGDTGDVINRLQELGIVTKEQMEAMGIEFSRSGQLITPVDEALNAILTIGGDKFGGLTEIQSQTFNGMLSNIKDWADGVTRTLGQPIFDQLKAIMGQVLDVLNKPETQAAIDTMAASLGSLAGTLADFLTPALENVLPLLPGLITDVANFVDTNLPKIVTFGEKLSEFLTPILAWISENIELKDVLIVLGSVLVATIIPAVISFLGAIAPVIAVVGLVIGAIALLRHAWESDFLGIRTTLTDVWENHLVPAFERIKEWLGEIIPPLVDSLKEAWERLQPAFQELGRIWEEEIAPLFGGEGGSIDTMQLLDQVLAFVADGIKVFSVGLLIAADFATQMAHALGDLIDWLQETGQKAQDTWNMISDGAEYVFNFISVAPQVAYMKVEQWIGSIAEQLQSPLGVLHDAAEYVFNFISVAPQVAYMKVEQWIGSIAEELQNPFWVLHDAAEFVFDVVPRLAALAFDKVTSEIGKITSEFTNLGNSLPDWLTPGSPTPLELGVRGINRAIVDWRRELPYLAADLRLNGELAMATQGAAAPPQERIVERHENYNLAIHSNARAEDVEQDFYQMKARAATGAN